MENIMKKRIKLGISQAEFAKKMGVNTSTVYRWEKGQIDIPSSTLCEIADALGCTTDWLLGRSESRK